MSLPRFDDCSVNFIVSIGLSAVRSNQSSPIITDSTVSCQVLKISPNMDAFNSSKRSIALCYLWLSLRCRHIAISFNLQLMIYCFKLFSWLRYVWNRYPQSTITFLIADTKTKNVSFPIQLQINCLFPELLIVSVAVKRVKFDVKTCVKYIKTFRKSAVPSWAMLIVKLCNVGEMAKFWREYKIDLV